MQQPTQQASTPRIVVLVLLKTLSLYAFAGWAYIAMNATFHPATLKLPLSHLAPWPHEDTFGAGCFVVSLTTFFCYQLLRKIWQVEGRK